MGWHPASSPGNRTFLFVLTQVECGVTNRGCLASQRKSDHPVETDETKPKKSAARERAEEVKPYRCKHLIAVLENPTDIRNIGTVIRNVNALGVEKTYIIDPRRALPDDWQDMRERKSLSKTSVSAIKWSFVRRFDSTEECLAHLNKNRFVSIVTSPHIKGRKNAVLHKADYTIYTRLAVWFGNEARGISDLALEHSEMCVGIPMFGMIESLNLGTTSGIVLYEITKQRRAYQSQYKRAGRQRKKPTTDRSQTNS
jgi:tRNA (guanosine-2'-O-)-methyltransferase